MKVAAQAFYLGLFFLSTPADAEGLEAISRSHTPSPDVCAISLKAIVSDSCASYATLDQLNRELLPALTDLTQSTDFFAYYRLNLFGKECPFWSDESGMCGNIACAVNTLDNEEDIPLVWRAEELGKLEGPKAVHPGKKQQQERSPQRPLQGMLGEDVGESCVVEYDDDCDERDYCVPEDEGSTRGDYVSLVDNPERFTGYAGEGAHQIWNAIYRENCFSKASFPHTASLGAPALPQGSAASELKSVLQERARQDDPFRLDNGLELEEECLEKRVFYRVISGMHTSISTHLCWDYLNQTSGAWGPNLTCYKDRLHGHPDRVSNLYFNYALVVRAITKLGPHLKDYTFCSGDPAQDRATKIKVQTLTAKAANEPQFFDESLMFVNGEGPSLKEDFRNRFRNVSRIMDCVGCDKCRLWGKLQTSGYGTALKVLFEFDDKDDIPQLKRTELVALFNTFARISHSLKSIGEFREMVEAEEGHDHSHVFPDRVTKPHHVVPNDEAVAKDFEKFEKTARPQPQSLKAIFRQETYAIWFATKYVVRGWIRFPKTIFEILVVEVPRLWDMYIGLPVRPRQWKFTRPSVPVVYDEL